MDLGNTWTEDNTNTTSQRIEKSVVQVTGTGLGMAAGYAGGSMIAVAVAGGPIGWGFAGVAAVALSPFVIDAGENHYYQQRGIE